MSQASSVATAQSGGVVYGDSTPGWVLPAILGGVALVLAWLWFKSKK